MSAVIETPGELMAMGRETYQNHLVCHLSRTSEDTYGPFLTILFREYPKSFESRESIVYRKLYRLRAVDGTQGVLLLEKENAKLYVELHHDDSEVQVRLLGYLKRKGIPFVTDKDASMDQYQELLVRQIDKLVRERDCENSCVWMDSALDLFKVLRHQLQEK